MNKRMNSMALLALAMAGGNASYGGPATFYDYRSPTIEVVLVPAEPRRDHLKDSRPDRRRALRAERKARKRRRGFA